MEFGGKYKDFFDVDENYFPCIDDSAIEAEGSLWEDTYPHEAFIALLKSVERMLAGSSKRSIWIHGSYGTGKSQCAYAVKKILEVPENELINYWNKYEPLKEQNDLLQKILGHKERKIITAYRYASGGITTPRDLFFAIQESVKESLVKNNIEYQGDNTLKESVIAWLEDSTHANFFDSLLKKSEWSVLFNQNNADEVLKDLKRNSNVKDLMDNIFSLADKEGITAMLLDANKLKKWLKDIIETNNLKIVLVWDEFSGFFKQNKNSLDEFQKIVALCQEAPFYFMIVTHQTDSIINSDDQSWSVVKQRFDFCSITLPDNIAFELIGHAFKIKTAAQEAWNVLEDDLNNRLNTCRQKVMNAAKIYDQKVMKRIMPIHPMAALVLKNIASSFQSNQRSMFDFIKTSESDDVKAFQWFINHTGPMDDHPLLTIDMLWNFFYEKGRDNLSPDIRMILDTFPQQTGLREDEKRVLKTILIMQAIDKRLGGAISLLKPTEQNISYAFDGISSGLDVSCKNIAKRLKERGILVLTPAGNNTYAYGAAVLAGDQAKIDEAKKQIRKSVTTAALVKSGNLTSVLNLSPALKLRFSPDGNGDIIPVTTSDFTRTINGLSDVIVPWKFKTVIAFACDESEGVSLRKMIKEAVRNKDYEDIVFIDATSSPLGEEDLNSYIEYAALSSYYSGNNQQSARENEAKAKQILSVSWKHRIYNNNFTLYTSQIPDGEKLAQGSALLKKLSSMVVDKFPNIYDFDRVTENQLKLTQAKASAKCGIIKKTSGVMGNIEKNVFAKVWSIEDYWTNSHTCDEKISIIKKAADNLIESKFLQDGQIDIDDICTLLEDEYGYAPSNLTAFLVGFILKDYSSDPYRYADSNGNHENMSTDKLAEMIGNRYGKSYKPTFIVKMTADEKAFYEVTEKTWNIAENTCMSIPQTSTLVKNKMQGLKLPVWCLKEVDDYGVYDVINQYIQFIQSSGGDSHKIALNIGKAYLNRPSLATTLSELVTEEKCKLGMESFISSYKDGKLVKLANDISAKERMIDDIKELFSVEFASLWNSNTGFEQIEKLIVDYSFVKSTNSILNTSLSSKTDTYDEWRDKLKFCICSADSLIIEYPDAATSFELLKKINAKEEILSDQLSDMVKDFSNNINIIKNYFDNENVVFAKIYEPYLEDISLGDINKLKPKLINTFNMSKTEANIKVKQAAEEHRSNQAKNKMVDLWKNKTGSKNPIEWSRAHRISIMQLVPSNLYEEAKFAFDILNRTIATEKEIETTIDFLTKATFLDSINDQEKIDSAFVRFIGPKFVVLKDINKIRDALEQMAVEPFEWNNNPSIRAKIDKMAKAEYYAGGSDSVVAKINSMSNEELKKYLIESVKENIVLGIEILNGGK